MHGIGSADSRNALFLLHHEISGSVPADCDRRLGNVPRGGFDSASLVVTTMTGFRRTAASFRRGIPAGPKPPARGDARSGDSSGSPA